MSRILRNNLYTGLAVWNGMSEHPVKVPVVIDAGQFNAVQEALKRNSAFAPRNHHRAYLLKGLLFCSCGRRMFGITWHGKRYYRCSSKDTQAEERRKYKKGLAKECSQRSLKVDPLEMLTSLQTVDALLHPEAVRALADEQRRTLGQRDEMLVRLDALNGQLIRIPEGRSRLIDAYTEGTINKPAFKEKMAALEARKARLEQEQATLQASMGRVQADEVDAARLAELLAKHGNDLSRLPKVSLHEWAEIVQATMRRVVI